MSGNKVGGPTGPTERQAASRLGLRRTEATRSLSLPAPLTHMRQRLMSEDERAGIVDFFASHPQAGDVIPGAGGLRKVRVPLVERGKRGGARVITCFVGDRGVYLLLVYAKNEQANPTPEQARALARLVETLF